MKKTKVLIVGSGPAGYTAAIYTARANLAPVVFEGFFSGPAGGQLMSTTDVENYPGFPHGVSGNELMAHFRNQALRFGAHCLAEDVISVDLSTHPYRVVGSESEWFTDVLIVATGATARRLDIPGAGDGEFWQKGVSACAVCDGAMPIFRNRPLYVIGGGDVAMEEASFLTKYGSRVFIVHRRDELRASKIMQERILNHPKIEVLWDSVVVSVKGDSVMKSLEVKNLKSGNIVECEAGGLFFAVGHVPSVAFLNGQLALNDKGYIAVEAGTTRTNKPFVFAAGDVQDYVYRQAITAAGSGCMAALDAEHALLAAGF